MLVFIDDSGDTGFKFEKGSSTHFVISCIIFEDESETKKTSTAIKELRRELKFSKYVEFKFNSSNKKVREAFLTKVNKFKYKIRCLVVPKKNIYSKKLQTDKNSFYSYIIKTLLQHSNDTIINAKIKIDGSGDRKFRQNFLTYLRKELNTKNKKIIDSCKLVDSKSNNLIQMADMITGSIRRSYDKDKNDGKIYKSIFKKHIQDEWIFE